MSKIKAVITDVDGCLTDGAIYQFRSGDIARRFSTLDGRGFLLLREQGIKVAIMTSAAKKEREILDRAYWLNMKYIYMDVQDKAEMTRYFANECSISLDDIAFLGNDFNDLEAMRLCGLSGCPSDAHSEIIRYCRPHEPIINLRGDISIGKTPSGYVCQRKGGEGAFREFVDVILNEFPH